MSQVPTRGGIQSVGTSTMKINLKFSGPTTVITNFRVANVSSSLILWFFFRFSTGVLEWPTQLQRNKGTPAGRTYLTAPKTITKHEDHLCYSAPRTCNGTCHDCIFTSGTIDFIKNGQRFLIFPSSSFSDSCCCCTCFWCVYQTKHSPAHVGQGKGPIVQEGPPNTH